MPKDKMPTDVEAISNYFGSEEGKKSMEDATRSEKCIWLYKQHVKHLEKDHMNEYAGVTEDGNVVIGKDLPEVLEKAEKAGFKGNVFTYKIGKRVDGF